MKRSEQLKLIRTAFNEIPELYDGFWNVRERLFDMNRLTEKQHRNGTLGSGFSVNDAARYFTVKHLLDGFNEPFRFNANNIISIRTEVLYAQAYANKYMKELGDWAHRWGRLEGVDYVELMK